jgi:hypothetical protein
LLSYFVEAATATTTAAAAAAAAAIITIIITINLYWRYNLLWILAISMVSGHGR